MKKIIFLLPVYNDWESLNKLFTEIDFELGKIQGYQFECIVINDSSTVSKPKIIKPKNLVSLKIINMKKNQGHARCNASGLRYIVKNEKFDYVILMDSDGEDRPVEIKDLIEKITEKPSNTVVAKRIKRSEGIIFKFLYQVHKLITFIFTGKKINFGNYSCLAKKDVQTIIEKPSLWSSFSGTLKKNTAVLNEINSIRGKRYFGPSKMSLYNLAIHSFSIIPVFKYQVFLRSTFMIIILSFLTKMLGMLALSAQILLIFFNLIIFTVSIRENEKKLLTSDSNILDEDKILH